MDRLDSFAVFVKAVELGSLTAAAESAGISSQLAGRHLQALESRLGVRLLTRTTRRQSLTDFGRGFYERAKSILEEVAAAESLAAEARAVPTGKLRINAPVSFGSHTLAPRLPLYMKAYPQVEVDLTLNNREVDLVNEGFDAVFRVGTLSDSGLIARPLRPYQMALCAAPSYLASHPPLITPHDLQAHECLCFAHTELRTQWSLLGPQGSVVVQVTGRMTADHGDPILQAAFAGMGILMQPLDLVQSALADGRLVRVLPAYEVPSRPMHVLYAPDRRVTPKLRTFLDFAISSFGTSSMGDALDTGEYGDFSA
jgi:DNA-binding transcriptional LysR family regulator